MWLSTSIWNQQDQSKPELLLPTAERPVTKVSSACGGGSASKIRWFQKTKQKKFIFLLIRPLYLKIIKKLCSPNITVSNQWRSHCLIYWGFLFCPWGEISRRPVYSWSLEVCSWSSALPGWDHRWWPRGLLEPPQITTLYLTSDCPPVS